MTFRRPSDIAALTNAAILGKILDVPLLAELGETLTELPADWRLMIDSSGGSSVLIRYKSVKK